MAKSDPKTMRFQEDVESYINAQKGENFSEKFHNLVRKFKDLEPEKEKRIVYLDKEIKTREKRLQDLNDMLFKTGHIERNFKDLQRAVDGCKGYLEHFLLKDLQKLVIQPGAAAPDPGNKNVLHEVMPGQVTV